MKGFCVYGNESSIYIKFRDFLTSWGTVRFSGRVWVVGWLYMSCVELRSVAVCTCPLAHTTSPDYNLVLRLLHNQYVP